MNRTMLQGTAEMTGAMLIFGTIGWLVLLSGRPVIDVVFARCLFGALPLLAICAQRRLLVAGILSRRRLALAVISGVAIVGNWLLLFAAYGQASIAMATTVYNTQPFMLVGLGALVLRERVTRRQLGWLILAFAGMVLIVTTKPAGSGGDHGHYLLGIALALGAGLLYAIAALITKALNGTSPHLIALIHVLVGLVMTLPFGHLPAWSGPAIPWLALVILGTVHTGLVYVLFYGAVQKLPTSLTGALSFIYPVAAIAVDHLALGHQLTVAQIIGAAVILLAAAGNSVSQKR